MSHVAESISRLVELARRLRTAAGELGQLDLKSQIVDEITTLQEIRDELLGDRSGDEYDRVAPTSREADPASSSERMVSLSDAGIGIFQPTGNDETYSLTPEGEAPPETSSNDAVASPLAPPKTAPSAGDLRAMIEMRIADLEQLEQAATRRMNDVPTAEQKQIKAKAQHAGREAGKAIHLQCDEAFIGTAVEDSGRSQRCSVASRSDRERASVAETDRLCRIVIVRRNFWSHGGFDRREVQRSK
jgi:hypothetical protein